MPGENYMISYIIYNITYIIIYVIYENYINYEYLTASVITVEWMDNG